MKTYDFLVVGGGILGLSLSRALRMMHPTARVGLVEKETSVGVHASGRSGGVIQAGFYHAAEPEKIHLTRKGNLLLTQFCVDHNLPLRRCGQLVVTSKKEELEGLKELERRAKIANIEVEWLNEQQTAKIDPNVKTVGYSLYCPSVSTMEPKRICQAMSDHAQQLGVDLHLGTKYLRPTPGGIMTNKGEFVCRKLFGTAGLYADEVAHDFNFARNYKIIPFTISFIKSLQPSNELRTNVFSVPNFDFPYLEVKQSPMPDGKLKIGPAATPTLWRESYLGLGSFKASEFLATIVSDLQLMFLYNNSKMNYPKLAVQEMRKRIKACMVREANKNHKAGLKAKFGWDNRGVIANLFDTQKKLYVEDLLVFANDRSCHVVNTIFPGFTTAMPIAELIAKKYSNQQ